MPTICCLAQATTHVSLEVQRSSTRSSASAAASKPVQCARAALAAALLSTTSAACPLDASALQYAELSTSIIEPSTSFYDAAPAASAPALAPVPMAVPSPMAAETMVGAASDPADPETVSAANVAVGAAALIVALGAGLYSQQQSSGSTSVDSQEEPVKMEEFDPEKAAARASEAGKWIELWRTKTEIRMRTEEAAAWIANFRAATNARERAARIQERAQWIANWRSAQLSTVIIGGSATGKKKDSSMGGLKGLVQMIKDAFKVNA